MNRQTTSVTEAKLIAANAIVKKIPLASMISLIDMGGVSPPENFRISVPGMPVRVTVSGRPQ
jgi:hypothetical protein